MKSIIVLSLMLFAASFSYADDYARYFECADKNDVQGMIDSLLSRGTRQYNLKEIHKRNADSDHIIDFIYLGANADFPDSVKLFVEVNFFMKDANPDMNITGTPVYKINSIVGEYLDVLPIYQIVAPETTAESAVRYGANTDVPDSPYKVRYSIRKSSAGWRFRRF